MTTQHDLPGLTEGIEAAIEAYVNAAAEQFGMNPRDIEKSFIRNNMPVAVRAAYEPIARAVRAGILHEVTRLEKFKVDPNCPPQTIWDAAVCSVIEIIEEGPFDD